MPAQLDSMMYVGTTPWHQLGTKLDEPATAAEAITAAGLDWEVGLEPVWVHRESGAFDTGKYAISNSSTGEVYYVGASDRYVPLQIKDAFRFFDGVVGAGEAIYHTAGSLKGGRVIWILAKLDGELGLPGDPAEKYIMLSNSHDGSMGVDMRFCSIRVVCANTLQAALREGNTPNVRLRHTPTLMQRINDSRSLLGLADAHFANMMKGMERLADKKLTIPQSNEYFKKVLGISKKKKSSSYLTNQLGAIQTLYHGEGRGAELVTAKGTAWGAFNAVSEWNEHHRAVRGAVSDLDRLDRRTYGTFYGDGKNLEERAWAYALGLAK